MKSASMPFKVYLRLMKTSGKFGGCASLHRSSMSTFSEIYGEQRGSCLQKKRRIVVTGTGMISPLGSSLEEVFENCIANKSSVSKLECSKFDYEKVGVHYCGKISDDLKEECIAATSGEDRLKSDAMKYAEFAAIQALNDADWHPTNVIRKYRTGICIGNSMTDMEFISASNELLQSGKARRVSPYFVPRVLGNMAAAIIAIRYGFRGPNHSVSTACSTGLHAIGDAFNFIRNGSADVMIAGGTDACISPLAIVGFSRARALSTKFKDNPTAASRPFDIDRDGFVMSEGAAVLVLEELDHAIKREANILCEVVGYGASCDADHITAGLPDGSGAILAMIGGLSQVIPHEGIDDELWLVNAHATSTPRGDAAEMNALRQLVCHLKSDLHTWNISTCDNGPFVSAHKSHLGHMMSAAGAIESAIGCYCLKSGRIPGIMNLIKEEEGIGQNVQLVREPIEGLYQPQKRRLMLKNSFGFGGTNATIVFAEYKP